MVVELYDGGTTQFTYVKRRSVYKCTYEDENGNMWRIFMTVDGSLGRQFVDKIRLACSAATCSHEEAEQHTQEVQAASSLQSELPNFPTELPAVDVHATLLQVHSDSQLYKIEFSFDPEINHKQTHSWTINPGGNEHVAKVDCSVERGAVDVVLMDKFGGTVRSSSHIIAGTPDSVSTSVNTRAISIQVTGSQDNSYYQLNGSIVRL